MPRDLGEVGAATPGWRIELDAVEEVEKFTAELETNSAIRTKLEFFEGSKVEVLCTIGTDVWFGTRVCAVIENVWIAVGEN